MVSGLKAGAGRWTAGLVKVLVAAFLVTPAATIAAGTAGFPVTTVLRLDQPIESGDYAWNAYISDRLEKNFRRTVFTAPGNPVPHPMAPRPAAGFGRRVIGQ